MNPCPCQGRNNGVAEVVDGRSTDTKQLDSFKDIGEGKKHRVVKRGVARAANKDGTRRRNARPVYVSTLSLRSVRLRGEHERRE